MRFFNEGCDVGVLGVDASDQAAQRTPDLRADVRDFLSERFIHPYVRRIVQARAQLPVAV